MSGLVVLDPGLQSSVQDLGREAFMHFGVPQSGAFDVRSLRIGNSILGNDPNAAAIELTMLGGSYRVQQETTICLTGAMAPQLNAEQAGVQIALEMNRPYHLRSGATIRVGRLLQGARAYLCFSGGILTEQVLGSRSSLVSLPAVGLGHPLRAGETLPLGVPHPCNQHLVPYDENTSTSPVRIVPGMHWSMFSEAQRTAMTESVFRVSHHSNRAGVRLTDAKICGSIPKRIPSVGMLPGFIQIPANGAPIVLGVDGPTMGGYPVIGSVAYVDLPRIAQASPRDEIVFQWIDREHAAELLQREVAD
ncbi:MAG: biotin-dependent carboxyltransferase family protein [Phycisphaerales bacterium]|nr:biotin-dependent carboxyltransferase family protein [Phycisphaerales bacterium]